MSKERLELIDDLVDILYADKIEIREFVRKSLDKDDTIDSMAHIIKVKNREMRELSNFLKERKIPLKELSPLITVMNHVRELEENHKKYAEFVEANDFNISVETEKIYKQNKRYREAIKDAIELNLTRYENFDYDIDKILNETLEESN